MLVIVDGCGYVLRRSQSRKITSNGLVLGLLRRLRRRLPDREVRGICVDPAHRQ